MTEDEIPRIVYEVCRRNIGRNFRLFLFGSRASGVASSTSDFDFFIKAGQIDEQVWQLIQHEIESLETLYKIDLVHWEKASDDFHRVISTEKTQEIFGE